MRDERERKDVRSEIRPRTTISAVCTPRITGKTICLKPLTVLTTADVAVMETLLKDPRSTLADVDDARRMNLEHRRRIDALLTMLTFAVMSARFRDDTFRVFADDRIFPLDLRDDTLKAALVETVVRPWRSIVPTLVAAAESV